MNSDRQTLGEGDKGHAVQKSAIFNQRRKKLYASAL